MTAERAAGPGPVQAGAPREELSRAGSKRFPMLRWLLLALVLTLASCAAPGAGEAPEPAQLDGTIVTPGAEDPEEQVPVVRIAVVTRLNDEAERGTRLALEQREGRVAGMPVEIATLAGPSSLTALAQEVEGLISAGRIHGLVVDLDPARAAVVATVAEAAGTPVLQVAAAADPSSTAIFTAAPSPADQGRALARYARDLGADQAAVVYDVTHLAHRTLARAFAQAFIDLGGAVPSVDAVAARTQNAGELLPGLAAAADSAPDVLLLALPGEAAPRSLVAAAEAGLTLRILGGPDWSPVALAPAVQAAGVEVVYPVAFHPDRDAPETAAFLEAYRDVYEQEPTPRAALAYDAAELLLAAVEAAAAGGRFDVQDPAATRGAVNEALLELREFRGATGIYTAAGEGVPRRSVVLLHQAPGPEGAGVSPAGEITP